MPESVGGVDASAFFREHTSFERFFQQFHYSVFVCAISLHLGDDIELKRASEHCRFGEQTHTSFAETSEAQVQYGRDGVRQDGFGICIGVA